MRYLLLLLCLLVAEPAFAQRVRGPGRGLRPAVIDVTKGHKTGPVGRGVAAGFGARRVRRVNAQTFKNDEVRVQLKGSVAGRDVVITQSDSPKGPATALFTMLQAVEAAHMGRAESVSVAVDEAVKNRFGRAFLDDVFGALRVRQVDYVGSAGKVRTERPSEAPPARSRAGGKRRTGRPLLWGGGSHPQLLDGLARELKLPTGQRTVTMGHVRGELRAELPADPNGREVVLLQTKRLSDPERFHQDMIEMLKTAWQAHRAGAEKLTVVMPYLPYSRSDRMDAPGVSVGAALLPQLMKRVGVDRVVFYSVHQAQEVGIFQALGIEAVHASGESILARRAASEFRKQSVRARDLVVMAPDAGAEKRARVFARFLARELGVSELPVVTANKERQGVDISLRFNADVRGKVGIAIDDETASGGTMNELAIAASGQGAKSIYAAVSHLAGPAYDRIDPAIVKKLFVLDTLPQDRTRAAGNPAIEVVGIAEHLGKLLKALEQQRPIEKFLFLEH